jgi:methionyl-tRNA formyltransferase
MTAPARTVFLGSGAFAVPILEALGSAPDVELLAAVTAPPRQSGRGLAENPSPVGAWAAEHGLATLTPSRLRDEEALAGIQALGPELLVLADYGRIVPGAWLEIPRFGALNVHPSLLPRHRGAAPIPGAILAGDRETGTSLMRMDAGVDTGPVVAQRSIRLGGDELAPALERELARMGAELLTESLPGWLDGSLVAVPQPAHGATVTRPLKREDGRLDPARPAIELERQVRAFQPWPGSFLETAGDRLVVWRARATTGEGSRPGRLVALGDGLGLTTADGVLELLDVQRSGGRRMSGAELVRGRPAWIGEGLRPSG